MGRLFRSQILYLVAGLCLVAFWLTRWVDSVGLVRPILRKCRIRYAHRWARQVPDARTRGHARTYSPVFFREKDLVLFISNGVITLRNMWGRPVHLEWRKRIQEGDLLGPTIYTSSPIIEGDPHVGRGRKVVTTVNGARQVVKEQKEAGYDFIKIYHTLSKETFDAIMEAAEEHEIRVVGHAPNAVGHRTCLKFRAVFHRAFMGV